jgi:hypothetical protein
MNHLKLPRAGTVTYVKFHFESPQKLNDARPNAVASAFVQPWSNHRLCIVMYWLWGWNILVGIETGRAGIESWWGARFSAPVQTDTGAHPASCRIGTGSLSPGVKRPRLKKE